MAGSFYWTLNNMQNAMDTALLASAPKMMNTDAIQKTYEQGHVVEGAADVANGINNWALAAIATGASGDGFWNTIGNTGKAMAAIAVSPFSMAYAGVANISSYAVTPGSIMVAPGTPLAVGDLKRLTENTKNTLKFFSRIESTTGRSLSSSRIGIALTKVKTGTSVLTDDYWSDKGDEMDWDEAIGLFIRDTIIEASNTPVSSIDVNGNATTVVVRSDPMREMRFLGNTMLTAAGGMAGMAAALNFIPGKKIWNKVSKITDSNSGGAISVAVGIIFVALLGLGLILAFVIPALPYTTWTLSLLTYLIVFAEAMIASLFWALSHAWPEGEGASSSLSNKGWMLYLQVMMTPILMLGGFFIGIQLVYIMGWWVDNTLFSTLSYAYSGTSTLPLGIGSSMGIFGAIGMLIVYTGLMLAIVWKSFDMTAELKNWVFEWFGGSPRAMGENQGQQQHIMGVVGGAKGGMTNAASSAAHTVGKNPQQTAGSPKSGGLQGSVGGIEDKVNAQPKTEAPQPEATARE